MKHLTTIERFKGSWEEVVDDCRFTVGKGPLGHDPSTDFKKKILISEHSPIRDLRVKWSWYGIKHWVGVHWVRHMWECWVRTQRSDRTGIPRDKLPQDEAQDFRGEANAQNTIDTWRKRLCYQASPETRFHAEDFKETLHETEPEWSDVLVPNCIYRYGCPELKTCGHFEAWLKEEPDIASSDIQKRYDAWNRIFYRGRAALHGQEG